MTADLITLWTVQPIEWYECLLKNGIIYGRKNLSDWYKDDELEFRRAYDWLVVQMEQRISPKPFDDALPIWAWYHYYNSRKKKPDLRNSGHLQKGQKGVRIELKKRQSEVLLSDFDLWHHPLNYFHILDTEEEDEQFDNLLKSYGLQFTERENAPTKIHKMIVNSWQKIFDMDYCPDYSAKPFEQKSIQATFWSLAVDEIIKVDEFIAK